MTKKAKEELAGEEIDLSKLPPEEESGDDIVVMVDAEGKETYYYEEMVFPVGRDDFALLVKFDPEAEEEPAEEEEEVVIAKVTFDEEGEACYVDPSEEEFLAALAAYEELMDELEGDRDGQ